MGEKCYDNNNDIFCRIYIHEIAFYQNLFYVKHLYKLYLSRAEPDADNSKMVAKEHSGGDDEVILVSIMI